MTKQGKPSLGAVAGASAFVGVSALVAILLVAGVTFAHSGNGSPKTPFCGPSLVRDYERPLRGLPSVGGLPPSGQVPFAPAALDVAILRPPPTGLLFVGTEPAYQLTNYSDDFLTLNWRIAVAVTAMAPDGTPGRMISQTSAVVGVLSPRTLLPVRGEPVPERGLFRVDLTFRDATGERLGSYSEYVRTVPAEVNARLRSSRRYVLPGAKIQVRVENLGTKEVRYGASYRLQRFDDGRWVVVKPDKPVIVRGVRGVLAGRAGPCESVRLPADAAAGRYRIVKRVAHSANLRPQLALRRAFRVVDAPDMEGDR